MDGDTPVTLPPYSILYVKPGAADALAYGRQLAALERKAA